MDGFNSCFEGRNVRTCCGSEVRDGARFRAIQWMTAFTEMGNLGEHIPGQVDPRVLVPAVFCVTPTPTCRHQVDG